MLAIAMAAGEMSYELNVATHSCEKYFWDLVTRNDEYVYILSLLYGIHMNYLVHSTFHLVCTQFLIFLLACMLDIFSISLSSSTTYFLPVPYSAL